MDIVLEAADSAVLDWLYGALPAALQPLVGDRGHLLRQGLSVWLVEMAGVHVLYFALAGLSFALFYDRALLRHPRALRRQVAREIALSLRSFPLTALATAPWFVAEIRGLSRLYRDPAQYGYPYLLLSLVWFLLVTDCGVYWIHRLEHHPALYSWLHKPHHAWKIATPFASFAFHPLDGYLQSLPMHIFVFLFPMNSYLYLAAFVFIQIWTVSIHDAMYLVSHPWINSAAHHTIHHLEFNYNYGQYFTLWDRIGGTYRRPTFEFENNMYFDRISRKDKTTRIDGGAHINKEE